ncbi:MAG: holo-ACP synthase [Tissierellia bacterium]|nr:holo-ACP synthase [Tissierellia bacterium]
MRPGIDLVSVERMRVLLERTPRFLERYFTEAEQAYIGDGARKAERMAAAFAAKEAVAKAMGTGFRGFTLQEIELSHRESGEPYIVLRDQALELFHSMGYTSISCSISHTDEMAAAIVIIEGGRD